jgi:putative ABC transport system permease protein
VQPAVSLRHGRTTTPAAERVRLTLIVGEMALALVLLVGAGLLLRTYSRLNDVDPGFAPGGLASIEVAPQGPRYFNDWNRVVAFYEAALSTIVAIPGCEARPSRIWFPSARVVSTRRWHPRTGRPKSGTPSIDSSAQAILRR